jgi:hypothetical protein
MFRLLNAIRNYYVLEVNFFLVMILDFVITNPSYSEQMLSVPCSSL